MTPGRAADVALAAALDSAVGLVASLAGAVLLLVLLEPDHRATLRRRAQAAAGRLSGAEARAWRRSPAARFARHRRAELVAAEMRDPTGISA